MEGGYRPLALVATDSEGGLSIPSRFFSAVELSLGPAGSFDAFNSLSAAASLTSERVSDRTIKSVIRDVQVTLGAKNRVQAVAEGIRQGLI